MKKITLLICACLCTVAVARGQTVKLGVFAGPNLSTIGSQDAEGEQAALALGFHAGLFTEIGSGHWSVEPALVFSYIGGQINRSAAPPDGDTGSETVALQYLQVPINLVYYTTGRKFFFGGGPYVGFGLGGNDSGTVSSTFEGISGSGTFNRKITFNSSTSPDYGINLLAGVHLQGGTFVTIGGSIGLKQATFFGIIPVRNDVISVSIGHSIF